MPVEPLAWRDRPSLIEVAFPAQKVSIEAQCERKANAGQTLTALGSYWKGRKPLVLVRACVLGALLPASGDTEQDLEVFEKLMAMDDDAFAHRLKKLDAADVEAWGGPLRDQLLDADGRWRVSGAERRRLQAEVLARMPYDRRLEKRSRRPEELPAAAYAGIWEAVNAHLGTAAGSHAELVEQMGILRFGHRPRLGDAFAGGGSIPFEAARLGCDVYASDLNPIACMLTWGALHIVGGDEATRARIAAAQQRVVERVDAEVTRLGIEHDEHGNRAKAYLYCVETRCPETGWLVPLAASWVISRNRRTVARLVPVPAERRFAIEIAGDASDAELERAARGTVRDGHMVYALDGVERRVPIRTLRGDRREGGATVNDLRRWEKTDIVPRPDDVFQERLYCIQWLRRESEEIFFRSVTEADLARERRIEEIVRANLAGWQAQGLVPDMAIEPGDETARLLRERGWTHWHHLFTPRSLLCNAMYGEACRAEGDNDEVAGALAFDICTLADRSGRLCRWHVGSARLTPGGGLPGDSVEQVFYNQALNVLWNYGAKSFHHMRESVLANEVKSFPLLSGNVRSIVTAPASDWQTDSDLHVTDPPYADAVIEYRKI
ncbi:DUF1156 domain-containing protein [bacterium]|nr:DUF1156 domain-containing protein [bacterium]